MPAARELYDRISSGRFVIISSTVSSLINTKQVVTKLYNTRQTIFNTQTWTNFKL